MHKENVLLTADCSCYKYTVVCWGGRKTGNPSEGIQTDQQKDIITLADTMWLKAKWQADFFHCTVFRTGTTHSKTIHKHRSKHSVSGLLCSMAHSDYTIQHSTVLFQHLVWFVWCRLQRAWNYGFLLHQLERCTPQVNFSVLRKQQVVENLWQTL